MSNEQPIDRATRQAAADCIALGYKYGSPIGCVRGQRPGLLADPELARLAAEFDAAKDAFAARLAEIAGPLDESGEPA